MRNYHDLFLPWNLAQWKFFKFLFSMSKSSSTHVTFIMKDLFKMRPSLRISHAKVLCKIVSFLDSSISHVLKICSWIFCKYQILTGIKERHQDQDVQNQIVDEMHKLLRYKNHTCEKNSIRECSTLGITALHVHPYWNERWNVNKNRRSCIHIHFRFIFLPSLPLFVCTRAYCVLQICQVPCPTL